MLVSIEPLIEDLRASPMHREQVVESFIRNNTGFRVQTPMFTFDRQAILWVCKFLINNGDSISFESSYSNERELREIRELVFEYKNSLKGRR